MCNTHSRHLGQAIGSRIVSETDGAILANRVKRLEEGESAPPPRQLAQGAPLVSHAVSSARVATKAVSRTVSEGGSMAAGAIQSGAEKLSSGNGVDPTLESGVALGAAVVGGFLDIVGSVWSAGGSVLQGAGEASVKVSTHRYGEETGNVTRNAVDSATNIVGGVLEMTALPKRFVRGMVGGEEEVIVVEQAPIDDYYLEDEPRVVVLVDEDDQEEPVVLGSTSGNSNFDESFYGD